MQLRNLKSAFCAGLFAVSMSLAAQTVDTAITGIVTDSTGAVIPGARVSITAVSTGSEKTATTSKAGDYIVNYLIPGNYNVSVTANGFGTEIEKGILLQVNQTARVNIVLKVGAASQTVSVESSSQPLLQTEDSSLAVVVGPEIRLIFR